MALMTSEQRRACWAEYMQTNAESIVTLKPDLRAAVDALDAFFDANAATINAALPQPARANLTVPQKALLLTAVIKHRYLSGV